MSGIENETILPFTTSFFSGCVNVVTNGYEDEPRTACLLPHKQAFRAATEGSGITQHEGQTFLPSRLLYSVLEKVSNQAYVSRSLRSRL